MEFPTKTSRAPVYFYFLIKIHLIMKSLTAILIYLGTFMGLYFLLSTIGLIWTDYGTVLSSDGWFMCYSMFLGWWMAILPTREYYVKYKDYFSEIF